VMKMIQTQSKGIRPIKYQGGNDLSIYTYLADVEYQVKAHFEWNQHRPELACDRNENKHYAMATRMIARGGRRDIFLGTRECQGYVEPCTWGEGVGAYDDCPELAFGLMFHGFTYPDESGDGKLSARMWYPVMRHGIVEFVRPEECLVIREIKSQHPKTFAPGESLRLADEEGMQ